MTIAQNICHYISTIGPELEDYLHCVGRKATTNTSLADVGHTPDFLRRMERHMRINAIGELGAPPSAHQRLARPHKEAKILEKTEALFQSIQETHPLLKGSTVFNIGLGHSNTGKLQADFHVDGLVVDRQNKPILLSSLEKRLDAFFKIVAQAEETLGDALDEPFTTWHLGGIDELVSAPNASVAFLKAYVILWPFEFLTDTTPSVGFGQISPYIPIDKTEFCAEEWRQKIISKGSPL